MATIAGVGVAALALPGSALAAGSSASVTITAAYQSAATTTGTPVITVGQTFDLVYTIANKSTTVTETGIAFNDQLPSGIVLDDNPGETPKNCAAGDANTGVSPNVAGSSTISVSGVSVAPSTSCTISFAVVSNAALAANQTADAISGATISSGTFTTTDTYVANSTTALGINVYADPTVTFSLTGTPTYAYDAAESLSFSSTVGAGDTLSSLLAFDDQSNAFTSGDALNTTVPGEHQITASVLTNAGGSASETFTYNVSSPPLTAFKTTTRGQVEFDLKYDYAGKILAELFDGKTIIGKLSKNVSVGKNTVATVSLNAAGKTLFAKATKVTKKRQRIKGLKGLKLTVLYTAGNGWSYIGTQPTITKTAITLK